VVEAVTNTMPKEEGRQAQKAKATREKIIAAVIALITEGGFAAASSSEITKRSGYPWQTGSTCLSIKCGSTTRVNCIWPPQKSH
jgi:hypothetical protein